MKKFIVEMSGSATVWITREIEVEAETLEEAKEEVRAKGYAYFKYEEDIDIDDDYTKVE